MQCTDCTCGQGSPVRAEHPEDLRGGGGCSQQVSEAGPSPAPAGTPSWATSTSSMSGTCKRRSSSPASGTSPTRECTAVYTLCRPPGTGEVAEPAGGGGRDPGVGVGWHPLIGPSPPPLPRLSSLRPLDLEFLQRLCRAVNVVPVIARADSLTIEEREAFRHRVIWAPGNESGVSGGRGGRVHLRVG